MCDKLITLSFQYTSLMKVWILHKLVVFIVDPRDIEVSTR